MMEEQDEVVENVDEGGLLVMRRALPKTEEPLKDGRVLLSLHKLKLLSPNSVCKGLAGRVRVMGL